MKNGKHKWIQWMIGCFSTSIILATLFSKHHLLIDVIAAIVLVEFLYKMVELGFRWFTVPIQKVIPVAKKSFSVQS